MTTHQRIYKILDIYRKYYLLADSKNRVAITNLANRLKKKLEEPEQLEIIDGENPLVKEWEFLQTK